MQDKEWTKHALILPNEEVDEDDEIDEIIRKVERKKRERIIRGNFFGI